VISNSDPGGPIKGPAVLSLQITRLTLVDGRTVSVKTNEHTVKGHIGRDAAAIGINVGKNAAKAAIGGGGGVSSQDIRDLVEEAQSTPAVVSSGTSIKFTLTSELKLDLPLH
jgi:hypothetical protein